MCYSIHTLFLLPLCIFSFLTPPQSTGTNLHFTVTFWRFLSPIEITGVAFLNLLHILLLTSSPSVTACLALSQGDREVPPRARGWRWNNMCTLQILLNNRAKSLLSVLLLNVTLLFPLSASSLPLPSSLFFFSFCGFPSHSALFLWDETKMYFFLVPLLQKQNILVLLRDPHPSSAFLFFSFLLYWRLLLKRFPILTFHEYIQNMLIWHIWETFNLVWPGGTFDIFFNLYT